MSHLPVNALAHTHAPSCAHTKLKLNSFRRKQQKTRSVAPRSLDTSFILSEICIKLSRFHPASWSHYRLTAVGARLMTSSGFPSVLCYSELLGLRSYSSSRPRPPSHPWPVGAIALMFHRSLMLRCHRAHWSHTPRVFRSVSDGKNRPVWCITWRSNASTSILRWNIFVGSWCGWKENLCVCVHRLWWWKKQLWQNSRYVFKKFRYSRLNLRFQVL